MLTIDNNNAYGTPFLIKESVIRRQNFLNAEIRSYIMPNEHSDGTGSSVSFSVNNTIKASLGEQLERSSMYKSYIKGPLDYPCFSMLNGELGHVNLDYLLLRHDLPVFKYEELSFSDSCGVASHKTSTLSINAAFLEFIERQSFIYSWLTESPGVKINIDEIMNNMPEIKRKLIMIKKYISEIYFFDISIHEEVKVILVVGFGEDSFSVGLNADWEIKNAIDGALSEFLESLEVNFYNHVNDENIELYKKIYMNIIPKEFRKFYHYLVANSIEKKNQFSESIKKYNFKEKVQKISKDLRINPQLTFIPSNFNSGIKIVKVFASEAFPHMNTMILEPENYPLTSTLGASSFPNKYRSLPFP